MTECILYIYKSLERKKAEKYLENITILKKYKSVENWLNDPNNRKERLYYLASWNYFIGQYEKQSIIWSYERMLKLQVFFVKVCQHVLLEGLFLEEEKYYLAALENIRLP